MHLAGVYHVKSAASLVPALLLAAACTGPPVTVPGTYYGEPITLSDTTLVSDIMADPERWVGERVLVTGVVVEVCENRGCWMDIASDAEFERIQIKVEDGEIVFPLSARGHAAIVEGTVEKLEYTEEEVIEREQNRAAEHGEEFDPATVTGPETIYRIRGIGAFIAD